MSPATSAGEPLQVARPSRQVLRYQARTGRIDPLSTPVDQKPWTWQRATPRRRPGEPTAVVAFHPFGYVSMPRKTSPSRSRRRLEGRLLNALGHLRDHEVGINPVYASGAPRNGPAHKAWLKKVREFNDAQTKKALAESERRRAE